jgi:hypothetical protein
MFTYVFHTRYRKNDKLVLYPLINYKTIQKYLLPSDPAFLSLHFMIISFVQTKLNPKYQFQIFPKISFPIPTLLLLYRFPPFPYLLSPFRLHLIFLSFLFHVFDCLSFLIAHSAPSFFSFHPILAFSLLISTSESRHNFYFSLSPEVLQNSFSHTNWIL